MNKAITNQSIKFVIFLLCGYYLPIILILLGIIPFDLKYHVLVVMTGVLIIHSIASAQSLKDLGFRRDTLSDSLRWNIALSFIFIAILLAMHFFDALRPPKMPPWSAFYFFYVLISSPCQEFIFRSKLFVEMRNAGIEQEWLLVAISAVSYCFLHIIYRDTITMIVTLFMGIIWGLIYARRPNFIGVTLSHAILGVVSIAVGLI